MRIFLEACLSPINLPFTVLLVMLLFYWITLILGAADIEMFDSLIPDLDADEVGGFFGPIMQILNIGDVPVMVSFSFLILAGWWFSLLANFYLNPDGSFLIAALLLLPNLIFSLVAANLLTRPVKKMFTSEKHDKALYSIGVVTTSLVTHDFGRVEIETGGAPIVINARTSEGTSIEKGERVIVYDEDREGGIYYVEPYVE